ncbi:MAG TPA: shikimate kinase [Halanaerobiaceae bacterium]|nr:shikimate kinase [Bacillota bacterium]HHU92867.1 shikimate kinase [Halanaerobiaceae bacterium]HOA41323.1 shikimate kinase [Halanaerobiales bacterium]HPZ63489.1 shikimate kinase [Halanaerobiales bacterium]HQD03970.1 shikimate kinase [Halanaerobiales bacterium]
MLIALIGFMGSGKSSVGRELARRLAYSFIDTDQEIERKSRMTIPEIFKTYGEAYFRQLEEEVLVEIIENNKEMVLATGGGIILSESNRSILREKTTIILLQAGAEELYNRVREEKNRPLLAVKDPLAEIKRLLAEREDYYNIADLKINTEGLAVGEIVDLIIEKLFQDKFN